MEWVVPRSAIELAKDDEFTLFAVTVFKKHSPEFVHKCREKRWTPREWKFKEGGRAAEDQESKKLEEEERRVWGEALRLGRTGYSDAVMAWVHVLTLRVFVETVLRYGLPLSFVCGLVKVRQSENDLTHAGFADTRHRRRQNWQRRPRRILMAHTRILVGTPLARIKKGARRRMTRPWPTTCRLLVTLEKTTVRTCFTSLRLSDRRKSL